MKKNILTIIIMALALINTILTGLLIFVIVPTSNKTTKLVDKVASIVDLELENPDQANTEVSVADIVTYPIKEPLTINLKSNGDGAIHYALVPVSLSMNSKHPDYLTLSAKMGDYENAITEIITEEVGKYTMDEVLNKKAEIKEAVKTRIQELFKSDFITNVTFGNMVLS